ncbi:MAG: BamA/TamA family outer membrane protein [Thermoanaerobaculia bacterium]|nr:BamA/TamA family outer membrane protein [Thermoanaerobaculia bacterium]
MTDVEEPIGEAASIEIPQQPAVLAELPVFEPDIEVTIDNENVGPYRGRKLFLEDAQSFFGVTSDQIFIGRVVLSFTNYLGDKRVIANVAAVDSLSDFDIAYVNLKNRWQWSARVFDQRLYRTFRNPGDFDRIERDQAIQYTGASFSMIYPLSFHRRFEVGASYNYRDFDVFGTFVSTAGTVFPFFPRSDDYPELNAAFVSDTTIFNPWGAISGHRLRLSASYAPDLDESGSLTSTVSLDVRKYVPLTRRSNLAFRAVAFSSTGNFPDFVSLGGLDTVRGFDIYEFSGHRGFYGNAEIRFPLIDQLSFPFLQFQGVRGVVFFDIGGSWFKNDSFQFWNGDESQLEDAIAAYGWGLTARFLGVNLNWDFAQRTRFAEDENEEFVTNFWIGARF